jgi:hypothetical protein
MKRLMMIFLMSATFLSACNGSQTVQTDNPSYPNEPSYPNAPSYPNEPGTGIEGKNPYSPQPGDSNLTRGNVFIENSELLIMESYPIQVALVMKGELPTPCNQLRVVVNPTNNKNRILVEVYSVIDTSQICAQVTDPFEANVALGSFQGGHYTVWVNGEMAGEFDA